jgi:hypothetical protein
MVIIMASMIVIITRIGLIDSTGRLIVVSGSKISSISIIAPKKIAILQAERKLFFLYFIRFNINDKSSVDRKNKYVNSDIPLRTLSILMTFTGCGGIRNLAGDLI